MALESGETHSPASYKEACFNVKAFMHPILSHSSINLGLSSKRSCLQGLMESKKSFRASQLHPSLRCTCFLYSLAFLMVVTSGLNGIVTAQEGDYAGSPMKESEKEAFYDVVEAVNPNWDWRALYLDPCGVSSPQGTSCDQLDGYWYLTALSFGPVYDNTPSCASNARIHTSISKLTHLKSLSFYQCFTGNSTTIPLEIASMKDSLKTLTLRNNRALIGDIPAELGGLLNLERLVVTGNSLGGGIPMELGQLQHLVQLDLSHNRLEGVIPHSLGNLRELVVLDLGSNGLSGQIPPSLGGLEKLGKLDFSRNMALQGYIPHRIGSLKELKLLDLSYNKLQGNLPTSLAGLAKLQELYLGNNNLSGAIPTTVWLKLTHLISLDLSDSGYEGGIPSTFGALDNLRHLSVENNRLTGGIPGGLGRLPHIYLLHLNGNNLSGPVPFSIGFVERLGPNLLLGGNKGLCSMGPNLHSSINMRVCSSSIAALQEAHQLSSASTLLSHVESNSTLLARPNPLVISIICMLVVLVVGLSK